MRFRPPAAYSRTRPIVGTRIAVCDVLEYLARGMTTNEIVHDFPDLTEAHVRAAITLTSINLSCHGQFRRLLHTATGQLP